MRNDLSRIAAAGSASTRVCSLGKDILYIFPAQLLYAMRIEKKALKLV